MRSATAKRAALALLLALVCVVVLGASPPQELTLRKLTIVDPDGETRLSMGTKGGTHFYAFDSDGNKRLAINAFENGNALLSSFDRTGMPRFSMGTWADGDAA